MRRTVIWTTMCSGGNSRNRSAHYEKSWAKRGVVDDSTDTIVT